MSTPQLPPPETAVFLRIDETNTIRVGQTRITLDVLLGDFRAGLAPEEIVRQMPTLTLADVHGALAYYFRHQAVLDDYLRGREEGADKLQQEIEAAQKEPRRKAVEEAARKGFYGT